MISVLNVVTSKESLLSMITIFEYSIMGAPAVLLQPIYNYKRINDSHLSSSYSSLYSYTTVSTTTTKMDDSLDNFLAASSRPPFLSCSQCSCDDYDPVPSDGKVTATILLCDIHKQSLMAPIPQDRSPSPSPVRTATLPNSTRTMAGGRRPGRQPQQRNTVISVTWTSRWISSTYLQSYHV